MEEIPQIDVNDLYALNLDGLSDLDILTDEYKSKLDELIGNSITVKNRKKHFWHLSGEPYQVIDQDFFTDMDSTCLDIAKVIFPMDTLDKIHDSYRRNGIEDGIEKDLAKKLKQVVSACDIYLDASPRKEVHMGHSEINGKNVIPTESLSSIALGLKKTTGVMPFNQTYDECITTSSHNAGTVSDVFSEDVIESIIDSIYESVNMYNSEIKQYSERLSKLINIKSKQPLLEQRMTIINACLNEMSNKPYSEETDSVVGILKESIDALSDEVLISDSAKSEALHFRYSIENVAENYILDSIKERGFKIDYNFSGICNANKKI